MPALSTLICLQLYHKAFTNGEPLARIGLQVRTHTWTPKDKIHGDKCRGHQPRALQPRYNTELQKNGLVPNSNLQSLGQLRAF